ncbi:hypothetical protein NQ318_011465 [Aromia moschata]|uniref:Uncharacterized protein n=1 Tax=Aromia moschata TaxID=1265417 RepID=A0AAV8Y0R1_9CUCU|nr:hypothetical protein NQ318_011465 [Aromia moschata]
MIATSFMDLAPMIQCEMIQHRVMMNTAIVLFSETLPNNSCHCQGSPYMGLVVAGKMAYTVHKRVNFVTDLTALICEPPATTDITEDEVVCPAEMIVEQDISEDEEGPTNTASAMLENDSDYE